MQREGIFFPLDLNTVITGTQTLGDMLHVFVHGWDFDQAEMRRVQAGEIVQALKNVTRQPIHRLHLPLLLKG